jgi:hypothetical protein
VKVNKDPVTEEDAGELRSFKDILQTGKAGKGSASEVGDGEVATHS